jgi:cytochrome oxidase Cu insertion factor (SCO1/SenC/PrrC family)
MNERRKFLAGLSLAGLLPVAGAARAMTSEQETAHVHSGAQLHGRSQLPESTVETHDGRTVQLYGDLIRNKVVVINFMSIANEESFPITANLAALAKQLGDRLEEEVRIISITGDPQNDTVERLRAFAEKFGAPKGWTFVRAPTDGNAAVASRLYKHGRDTSRPASVDIVHYGNDAVGLWAAFPALVSPEDAAWRVRSVMNGKPVTGELVQAGPRRLDEAGPSFNNRAI